MEEKKLKRSKCFDACEKQADLPQSPEVSRMQVQTFHTVDHTGYTSLGADVSKLLNFTWNTTTSICSLVMIFEQSIFSQGQEMHNFLILT